MLTDFILECTISNGSNSQDGEGSRASEGSKAGESSRNKEADIGSDLEELWMLHIDGLSNASRARAGLILIGPEGDVVGYALHFEFSATNNKVEYEAILAGLRVAREAGAQHLKIFSDSQPVVGHKKGEYKVREENMKRYL